MSTTTISRADLESKLRGLQDSVQGKVQDRKQSLMTAAAAGGVVLMLIFFLLGKRSGRKKTTFVEIRRV
jgi:hypothetical protein